MKLMQIYEQVMKEADYDNDAGAGFWGNIGAGVLPIAQSSGRILAAMRSEDVNEPNTWGVIGGKLDEYDGESDVKAAAMREFKEETGYHGSLKLHPAYVFKAEQNGEVVFTYHNFIGIIPEEFDAKVDWETAYFKWVMLDDLLNLSPIHFGLKNLLKDGKSMQIIKKFAR